MTGIDNGTHVEDFLNPKSMPTPAAAGAIVALITAALFKNFGVSVAICSIFLSFMVGLIVYQSREFKSAAMSRYTKLILYALNSLIIFAMATGTTSVMADEIMVQQRPFFYDWTKQSKEGDKDRTIIDANQPFGLSVRVTEEKSRGVKGFLQRYGIITKNYSTTITLVSRGDAQIDDVKKVELRLPKDDFENSNIVLSEDELERGLNIKAWKGFQVEADVTTADGSTVRVNKYVNPSGEVQF